jgi:hypothetical protein
LRFGKPVLIRNSLVKLRLMKSTLVRRPRTRTQGRGPSGKTIVLGALQRGTESECIKLTAKVSSSTDSATLKKVKESVEKGSTLHTNIV